MQEASLLLSLLNLILVLRSGGAESQKGSLYCFPTPPTYEAKFVLYNNDDPVKKIYAFDLNDNPMFDDCSSIGKGFIEGDGSADTPFVMIVKWYINQTVITDSDCGLAAATGNKYTWYVESSLSLDAVLPPVMRKGEFQYNLLCDFNSATGYVSTNGSVQIDITDRGGARNLTNFEEDVSFYVGDENGNAVRSIFLGDMITLNIHLNVKSNGGATGVYATSCRACSNSLCDRTSLIFPLTDETGCLVDGTFLDEEKTKFFYSDTAINQQSIVFESFRFVSPDTDILFFSCRMSFCTGTNTQRCVAGNPNCVTRTKRSADTSKTEKMNTFVLINKNSRSNAAGRTQSLPPQQIECKSMTMYMVLTIVLGILLVAAVILIAVIIVRKKGFNKKDEKNNVDF